MFFVYMMASKRNGTIYIGVTNDLKRRAYEHRMNLVEGFTSKYSVHLLVYYEIHNDPLIAISREKYLKGKSRTYKLNLIELKNPDWNDLYEDV